MADGYTFDFWIYDKTKIIEKKIRKHVKNNIFLCYCIHGAFYLSLEFYIFLLMDLIQFMPKETSSSQAERTACTSTIGHYDK
jgi:hypothetical protein